MSASTVTDFSESNLKSRLLSANGAEHAPRTHSVWNGVLYALIDVLLACAGGLLAYHIRFSFSLFRRLAFLDHPAAHAGITPTPFFAFLLMYLALLVLVSHAYNLYRLTFIGF